MFSEKDIQQFEQKGISKEKIEKQIEQFKEGFLPLDLVSPATIGNGIKAFEENEVKKIVEYYDKEIGKFKVTKFVPASGAASRMFKNLQSFLNERYSIEEQKKEVEKDDSFNSVGYFFKNIRDFAFFEDLKTTMQNAGSDLEKAISENNVSEIIEFLLTEKGLNYANLPKALLKFHKYGDCVRTSLEEHLVEAALYAKDENGKAYLHFTLSEEFIPNVKELLNKVLSKYEEKYEVKFEIDYSIQSPSTDTIAVDMDNKPFRNADGSILFRPGGHGALIENLNNLDSDIVFVKNIDNVVPDSLKEQTIIYKKVIGSYLIQLQNQIFEYIDLLADEVNVGLIKEITEFFEEKFFLGIPDGFSDLDLVDQADFLYEMLNRPIRVCGMVKNEGEPGGGPFMVYNDQDFITAQIVEGSQIDTNDEEQKEILDNATHFNPVDLVCSLKDVDGEKYDLNEFVDAETGFISNKSKDGRDLKALELPGLWNGAMADWNTVFVEVPLVTFNPVKYVNDLLREQHQ
jgi:hypothetical protein